MTTGPLRKSLYILGGILLGLTLVGVLGNIVLLTALAGLVLLLLLLLGFALAHSLVQLARSYIRGPFGKLGLSFALIIRGILLSLSFWTADLYAALCERDLSLILHTAGPSLLMSIVGMLLFSVDASKEKTVHDQGAPSRLASTFGYFSFFRQIIVLGGGLGGERSYRHLKRYFGLPPWFLSQEGLHAMADLFARGGFVLWNIVALLGVFGSISILRHPRPGLEADARNAGWAMLAVFFWMLSAGLVVLYALTR